MVLYQFHFFTPDGARPMLDFGQCVDDAGAAREAFHQMHRHGSCLGVEVYQDERLVARLEKPPHMVMPVGAGLHGAR